MTLPSDANWPRAGQLLRTAREFTSSTAADIAVLGLAASRRSISPTQAHTTPAAIRAALLRMSTWCWDHDVDLGALTWLDAGDIADTDDEFDQAVSAAMVALAPRARLTLAVGGDNSITRSVGLGLWQQDPSRGGLITVDAHHDLRDGRSNGSPVRELIEAGLPGTRVVQIGIASFANSPAYAARARDLGITVITRDQVERRGVDDVMAQALEITAAAPGGVYVDLDIDACDRAVVPACPAALPGGLSAFQMRRLAYLAGNSPFVRCVDITEVDAAADSADQRTVRLGALVMLEAACGLASR
jgi:formiminoglutamase